MYSGWKKQTDFNSNVGWSWHFSCRGVTIWISWSCKLVFRTGHKYGRFLAQGRPSAGKRFSYIVETIIYHMNQLASPKLAFWIYLSNFCDKFGFGLDRGQTVDRPWNAHCGAWKVHFGTWKGHSGTWTGVPHITPKNIRICLGLALDHRPSKLSKIRALFQG